MGKIMCSHYQCIINTALCTIQRLKSLQIDPKKPFFKKLLIIMGAHDQAQYCIMYLCINRQLCDKSKGICIFLSILFNKKSSCTFTIRRNARGIYLENIAAQARQIEGVKRGKEGVTFLYYWLEELEVSHPSLFAIRTVGVPISSWSIQYMYYSNTCMYCVSTVFDQ